MKIYIAEDEPLAAAKLKLFIEKLGEGPDITLLDNGINTLAALRNEVPDILFLDIQMPGITGMEILESIELDRTQVIITTAYDHYALPAFSFNVTDYLLKPYTIERLKVALEKAKNTLRLQQLDMQVNASTITIKYDGKTEVISTSEIVSLYADKDYTHFALRDGSRRMVLGTLSSFESQLPDDFMRIHRSTIINRNAVVSTEGYNVNLCDGQQVAVGKTYRGTLKK